jgi:hypothetical protein
LGLAAICRRRQVDSRRKRGGRGEAPPQHRTQSKLADFHFFLAAALANLGKLDEALAETRFGLALDPAFTIRRFRAGQENDNPIFLAGKERILGGMREAGVPEG